MKKMSALLLSLCLFLLCGCSGINISGVSPFRNIRDDSLLSGINDTLDAWVSDNGISDVSLGVLKGTSAAFANRGQLNEHSKAGIGQMTGMFTGLLVSNFEYNSWIDRDQFVDEWINTAGAAVPSYEAESGLSLPSLSMNSPSFDGRLTVGQLACAVSGLGEFDTFGKSYATVGMMYNQLDEAGFLFAPSSSVSPSSLGTALLCECLRQSYNMNANFVNLINNQVIVKMDMQESEFEKKDALAGFDGYQSTVYDLLKTVGYLSGAFDSDEAFEKTVEGALSEVWSDGETSLSLAFNIEQMGGYTVYTRQGMGDGYSSYIAFVPELDTGISVICSENTALDDLAGDILSLILNA